MTLKQKKVFGVLLILALALSLTLGLGMTALADGSESTYTLTIPARVNVTSTGWKLDESNTVVDNPGFTATEGLTASGSLPAWHSLYVTAQSQNGFYLNGRLAQIQYSLCAIEHDAVYTNFWQTPPKTEYNFRTVTSEPTTLPMGVVIQNIADDFNRPTFPTGAYTDVITFTAKVDWTSLSLITGDFTAMDGQVLTGQLLRSCIISIPDGATVTLRDVTINDWGSGRIICLGDATIILVGESSIDYNGAKNPTILVPEGKKMTIRGDGSLNVVGHGGAAIGGGYEIPCGDIEIAGGTVNAVNYSEWTGEWDNQNFLLYTSSAAIGGGEKASCGNITISGGTVTAYGTDRGAGIGSGPWGSGGNITITGGTMKAISGNEGAAIGSGMAASCGDITISNTVTRVEAIRESGEYYYIEAHSKHHYPPHVIGKGSRTYYHLEDYYASCGTIRIGGQVVQSMDVNEYIYEP